MYYTLLVIMIFINIHEKPFVGFKNIIVNYYYKFFLLKICYLGLNDQEILAELPSSVQKDISLFLNSTILEKVPFFQGASEQFISSGGEKHKAEKEKYIF